MCQSYDFFLQSIDMDDNIYLFQKFESTFISGGK